MTILKNIETLARLEKIVNNHLCGGTFSYEDGKAKIIFFQTFSGLGGVQVSLGKGKINALEILIKKLDELYNEEFAWSKNHVDQKEWK